MKRLLLVLQDLTNGGTLDAEGVLLLGCLLLCISMLLGLAISLWRDSYELDRAIRRHEEDGR